MALKHTIKTLDEVDEKFRGEYKETEAEGGKVFVLDVEGGEDVGALKRALEHEREANKRERAEKLRLIEDGKKKGQDVSDMEASYKKMLEDQKATLETSHAETQKALKAATKDVAKKELLGKLTDPDSADLLEPHIDRRLKVEIVDGRAITRVLDKDGKMSAMSLSDLEAEIRADKKFAAVLTASRGSGTGGASPERDPSVGGRGGSAGVNPNTMTLKEKAAWAKSQRAARGGK